MPPTCWRCWSEHVTRMRRNNIDSGTETPLPIVDLAFNPPSIGPRRPWEPSPIPGADTAGYVTWATENHRARDPHASDPYRGVCTAVLQTACPACARRYAMQIDLDCPICAGAGQLLVPFDETAYDTDSATRHTTLLLEEAAKTAIEADPTAAGLDTARERLDQVSTRLQAHGLQQQHADIPVTIPSRLDEEPLEFHYTDRPLEHGGIPWFSAAGYRSFLARACDPLDPLDITEGDTVRRATRRERLEHRAHIGAKAILYSLRQHA